MNLVWPDTAIEIVLICVLALLARGLLKRLIKRWIEHTAKRAEEPSEGLSARAAAMIAQAGGLSMERQAHRTRTVGTMLVGGRRACPHRGLHGAAGARGEHRPGAGVRRHRWHRDEQARRPPTSRAWCHAVWRVPSQPAKQARPLRRSGRPSLGPPPAGSSNQPLQRPHERTISVCPAYIFAIRWGAPPHLAVATDSSHRSPSLKSSKINGTMFQKLELHALLP